MDYEQAIEEAPPGWRHFSVEDIGRLPRFVRARELARVPQGENGERVVRALISPEKPEWFEAQGWDRITAPAVREPEHPAWIDDFFGPPSPPRELLMAKV